MRNMSRECLAWLMNVGTMQQDKHNVGTVCCSAGTVWVQWGHNGVQLGAMPNPMRRMRQANHHPRVGGAQTNDRHLGTTRGQCNKRIHKGAMWV